MGKVNLNMKKNARKASKRGGAFYKGPIPPKGSYLGTLKRLELVKENSAGDPMLRGLLEINEPKKSKASKYNGYGVWFNQNLTDVGAEYCNGFLDALAGPNETKQQKLKDAFWGNGMVVDGKGEGHVLKIGTVRIGSPEGKIVLAFNGRRKGYQGEIKLDVAGWLILDEDGAVVADDDEYEEDDEYEDEYEAEDEEDDEEDEEDDEEDDEDDEEEEEDEPKPKKKKAKKTEDDEEDEEEVVAPKKKKAKGKKGRELF